MLNLFKYIAVVIMLLATGEFLGNVVEAANGVSAAAQATADAKEAGGSGKSGDGKADSAKPEKTVAQQFRGLIAGTLEVCINPLIHFCYGATLFVLVRIARDQAHDLAVG